MTPDKRDKEPKQLSALLFVSSRCGLGELGKFAKAEISDGQTTMVVSFHVYKGVVRYEFEDENWKSLGVDPSQITNTLKELEEHASNSIKSRRQGSSLLSSLVVVLDRADAP